MNILQKKENMTELNEIDDHEKVSYMKPCLSFFETEEKTGLFHIFTIMLLVSSL